MRRLSRGSQQRLFLRAHSPVLLAVALFTLSCGYQSVLGPVPAALSESGQAQEPTRIVVMAILNDSPEPWLDRIVTDAMRREMSARGAFNLVDERSDAELILRGRVRPLGIRSKSFSGFVAALEYELTVVLDLDLVLASGQVVRLDPRMLSESDVYLASADIEVTRTNRLETLRRLSDLLSSRVADSIELIQRPMPAKAPMHAPMPTPTPEPAAASYKGVEGR